MKKFYRFIFLPVFLLLFVLGSLFLTCKSKPVPPVPEAFASPVPSASLVFNGIEADDPGNLNLFFTLQANKETPSGVFANIESWRVFIDGQNASSAFKLDYSEGDVLSVNSPNPLRLNMDVAALASMNLAPRDDYSVTLTTALVFFADSFEPVRLEVSGLAEFPGAQAPRFHITAIAILKAELVNTRFRVTMKIENPNPFPIDLSSFTYKLYGNGRFWAEGVERNLIQIPGKSAVEGNLFMLMNFIDMDRNLLNQIINLVDVNYRFAGETLVSTTLEYLPAFDANFNLSGYSVILER